MNEILKLYISKRDLFFSFNDTILNFFSLIHFDWFYAPLSDITIRMESTDTLSTSSCHGEENTERFQSSVYTGRRVSFNETAIYEESKKNQEKGRRSGNIIGGVEWCGLLSVRN